MTQLTDNAPNTHQCQSKVNNIDHIMTNY